MSEQRNQDQRADPAGGARPEPAEHTGAGGRGATPTIEIDEPSADLEAAMRDALAAVEAVEAVDPPSAAARAAGGAGDPAGQPDVAALRRELDELRDRSVRTLADFDNFRKRTERERQDTRRYALLEPLREFLPVADNLERALSAGGAAEDLKRGVEMILRQMQELLRRFGAREVPAAGEVFNPAVHEAVARTESDQVTVPTVAEELVRGYMLHDRLLRPAIVRVAVPAEKGGSSGPATAATGSGTPDS
jgi:molecular chaperone GrpE